MKKTLCIVIAMALMLSLCGFAFASSSYQSENKDYTVGGRSYYAFSVLNINNNTASAGTYLVSKDFVNVPIGYLGAGAKLIASSGNVLAVTPMSYNTSVFYFENSYTGHTSFNGYVHSKGQVSMYTGATYVTYDAPQTVNATSTAADFSPLLKPFDGAESYQTNAVGETYGSALIADVVGYTADLISAVGIDGIEGYIRADDLDPKVKTPAGAMAYMVRFNSNRIIPLYNKDGTTIGTFELDKLDTETVDEAKVALAELTGDTAITPPATPIRQPATISVRDSIALLKSTLIRGEFPKNAEGQSYGSDALSSIVGHQPDLIMARGTNGTEGYVKATDFNGPVIHNPKEAVDYMANRGSRTIPLYDLKSDIVGEFLIG